MRKAVLGKRSYLGSLNAELLWVGAAAGALIFSLAPARGLPAPASSFRLACFSALAAALYGWLRALGASRIAGLGAIALLIWSPNSAYIVADSSDYKLASQLVVVLALAWFQLSRGQSRASHRTTWAALSLAVVAAFPWSRVFDGSIRLPNLSTLIEFIWAEALLPKPQSLVGALGIPVSIFLVGFALWRAYVSREIRPPERVVPFLGWLAGAFLMCAFSASGERRDPTWAFTLLVPAAALFGLALDFVLKQRRAKNLGPPRPGKRDAYLPALTGVRALAAYAVFFHHFPPPAWQNAGVWGWCYRFVLEGHVGVGMFYILSGFMITYRYYSRIQFTGRWIGQYLRNRFARIYPIYLLLTVATFQRPYPVTPFEFVIGLTMSKGFFDRYKFTGNGIPQAWSLTVEECFYLLAPLVFLFVRRRRYWIPLLGIPLMGVALVKLNIGYQTFFDNFQFMMMYTFFGRFFEFGLGIALALLFAKGWFRKQGALPLTYLGAIGCVAATTALAYVKSGESARTGLMFGDVKMSWYVIAYWVFPVLVTVFYAGLLSERTWLARGLGSHPTVLLGKSSYAFYLIHMGIIMDYVANWLTRDVWVAFVVLVVLAVMIHSYVEEPLNRLLRGRVSS